jgi:hypothetical protein
MITDKPKGWIGVDLDGTLAVYDGWKGLYHIGAPVPAMVHRIRKWLHEGWEVRIFTARVTPAHGADIALFEHHLTQWLILAADLPPLAVTNVKDFEMVELWDDRAVTVEANTGKALAPSNITRGIA